MIPLARDSLTIRQTDGRTAIRACWCGGGRGGGGCQQLGTRMWSVELPQVLQVRTPLIRGNHWRTLGAETTGIIRVWSRAQHFGEVTVQAVSYGCYTDFKRKGNMSSLYNASNKAFPVRVWPIARDKKGDGEKPTYPRRETLELAEYKFGNGNVSVALFQWNSPAAESSYHR